MSAHVCACVRVYAEEVVTRRRRKQRCHLGVNRGDGVPSMGVQRFPSVAPGSTLISPDILVPEQPPDNVNTNKVQNETEEGEEPTLFKKKKHFMFTYFTYRTSM